MAHDSGRNIVAAIAYIPFLAVVVSLAIILVEKEDKYIRFHAFQSLFFSAGYYLVNILLTQISKGFLALILGIVDPILTVVALIIWLVCLYLAYRGRVFKLPYIGNFAERQAK